MMNYHVLTLFPEMILDGLHTSIIGRAIEAGLLSLEAVNIRDFAENKHNKVDDYPYGGGAGMVMQAEPVYQACEAVQKKVADRSGKKSRVIYVTPQGTVFHQSMAEDFAKEEDLIFLCGHYEGIDERVLEEVVTDYVSIGDYVLTGGELPAMVMIDAISRLVPGVLSNEVSAEFESFHDNLLEYPQYSRPEVWHGKPVPPVLLSGNHTNIEGWRREHSILRTRKHRPDLYGIFQEEQQKQPVRKRKIKAVIFALEGCLVDSEQELMPFAKEFLEMLKEEGLNIGVAGSSQEALVEQTLKRHGIYEMFDVMITGSDIQAEKPAPGVYLKALKKLQVKRTEAIAFENSSAGVLAAKAAGVRVVYISNGQRDQESRDLPCYQKIADFVEGMAVVRRMIKGKTLGT